MSCETCKRAIARETGIRCEGVCGKIYHLKAGCSGLDTGASTVLTQNKLLRFMCDDCVTYEGLEVKSQQHPRLARGESYSCGYKPYRCEICNYSTTTKGNLSIHMQSDKHLNNMQELNSSQSMLAAVVVAANNGDNEVSSKLMLSGNLGTSQQRQSQQNPQLQQSLLQSQSQQANTLLEGSSGSGSTSVDSIKNCSSMLNRNKPSFRCDICSYETSVARNLRIHMSSEKHAHNIAALQNNIKHIQAYTFLHHHQQAVAAAAAQHQLTSSSQGTQESQLCSGLGSGLIPEIALADLAYNQAMMIQVFQNSKASVDQHQQQIKQQQQLIEPVSTLQLNDSPCTSPQLEQPTAIQKQLNVQTQQQFHQLREQLQQSYSSRSSSPSLTLSTSDPFGSSEINVSSCTGNEALETFTGADPYPTKLYTCLICDKFSSNSLDELNQHLLLDRSRNYACSAIMDANSGCNAAGTQDANVMVVLNNNYICRLCNYKTNLKANFQLHSKTDKHIQKLNFVNHIREGGAQNEYKLGYLQLSGNTVQLKCNCCDFYTNSIQKLSLHTQHIRHETMRMTFQYLLYIMQRKPFEKNEPMASEASDHTEMWDSGNAEDTPSTSQNVLMFTNKLLSCGLCNYSAPTLLNMIQHVKSLRHMQVEQLVSLQRHNEPPSLDEIFKVIEKSAIHSLPLSPGAPLEGKLSTRTCSLRYVVYQISIL